MNCIICNKPATDVRSTQFAGDHPYCKEHAKQESDYGENDSYTYWYEVCSIEEDWDNWKSNRDIG